MAGLERGSAAAWREWLTARARERWGEARLPELAGNLGVVADAIAAVASEALPPDAELPSLTQRAAANAVMTAGMTAGGAAP